MTGWICQKKGSLWRFASRQKLWNFIPKFLHHHRPSHKRSVQPLASVRQHWCQAVSRMFAPTSIIAWLARPSLRWLAVSHKKEPQKKQPCGTLHWLGRSILAGWRLLTRWPLIRSIIRLWWRLGMWGMSVCFSHLPCYPAPTLDSLRSYFRPLCCFHWLHPWVSWRLNLLDAISTQLVLRRRMIKKKKRHSGSEVSSAAFHSPVWCTQSSVSLHYQQAVCSLSEYEKYNGEVRNSTKRRRWQRQFKKRKSLFSDKQGGRERERVPTFENGGPLLVPHLFELPSEVPRWERLQWQAGKAPQDDLVQALRALCLTLGHVPHGSLLRRHGGRRRALRCSYHSSMWRRLPSSPSCSTSSVRVLKKICFPPLEQSLVEWGEGKSKEKRSLAVQRCSKCCQPQPADVL